MQVELERRLVLVEGSSQHEVTITFGPLSFDEESGDARLLLRVRGLGRDVDIDMAGVDGLQALQAAILAARAHVEAHPAYGEGRLYWLDEAMGHGLEPNDTRPSSRDG